MRKDVNFYVQSCNSDWRLQTLMLTKCLSQKLSTCIPKKTQKKQDINGKLIITEPKQTTTIEANIIKPFNDPIAKANIDNK